MIMIKDLPEFMQRMAAEKNDLGGRIKRCADFINSEEFQKLNNTSKSLLATQFRAMETYAGVLDIRLTHELSQYAAAHPEIIKPDTPAKPAKPTKTKK